MKNVQWDHNFCISSNNGAAQWDIWLNSQSQLKTIMETWWLKTCGSSPFSHLSPWNPTSQRQVVFSMVSQHRPRTHDVSWHCAVNKEAPHSDQSVAPLLGLNLLLTFETDGELSIGTFLIIPLPAVFSLVHVDLDAELRVVVVGLISGPRLLTNPRAVIPNPGPGIVFVVFSDSNPVIWTAGSVWQLRDYVIILLLALDDHHVCESSLAKKTGIWPVPSHRWVVIGPSQGDLNHEASCRMKFERIFSPRCSWAIIHTCLKGSDFIIKDIKTHQERWSLATSFWVKTPNQILKARTQTYLMHIKCRYWSYRSCQIYHSWAACEFRARVRLLCSSYSIQCLWSQYLDVCNARMNESID